MTKAIVTSAFGTVPVVAFYRLHVETHEPISFHSIVFQDAGAAKAKASWIESQSHLKLIGITDATFADESLPTTATPVVETPRTEYGIRLDHIHSRIAARLGEKPVVFYAAYESDEGDLPIDNLDEIAIEGKVKFRAEHDPDSGEGDEYTSPVLDSPTWLDVAVLANQMIKTTGDYHHQFLESVCVLRERDGIKIAGFSMGS